jgi:hypothetical protein
VPPSSSSAEAWPDAESPDELHDALLTLGFVTDEEGARSGWERLFDAWPWPGGPPARRSEQGATLLVASAPSLSSGAGVSGDCLS